MKVAIVGTRGIPANYGGYETLTENLVKKRQNKQINYTVYCSSKAYTTRIPSFHGAQLIYLPFKANGWQALIYDTFSIIHAYFTADIILSLGTVGCYILPLMKLFSRKRVIVNLDGLDNKRAKWGSLSRAIIGGARRVAAKYADIRISDNEAIVDYVRNIYRKESALIEYGGDNAYRVENAPLLRKLYNLTPGKYIFKVARIEPENNIEMILSAFSALPNHLLVVVGNWNKGEFGKRMRAQYARYTNIRMLDPEYDEEKINLLRSNCQLYIHGHSAGGTNPSLVEAMHLEIPILAFDVVYNRCTTENRALYFSNIEQLKRIIGSLDTDALSTLSKEMKQIADRRYTWSRICTEYERIMN